MKISAKIISDSLSPTGVRLTTMQLCYPRFIHSEFMTHRMFSRNAASSRAIPVAKMIEQVRSDPAMPLHWGKNQPGMQANEELAQTQKINAIGQWCLAAAQAADIAEKMNGLGLHKQVANRLLEPFQWMHTIVTATEWDNFYTLRLHADADPNIRALAVAMSEAEGVSIPIVRMHHLPYMHEEEMKDIPLYNQLLISAARCARVSYLTHDGSSPDSAKDLALAEKLKSSGHASPFEHVAVATYADAWHANFRGWKSLRNNLGI